MRRHLVLIVALLVMLGGADVETDESEGRCLYSQCLLEHKAHIVPPYGPGKVEKRRKFSNPSLQEMVQYLLIVFFVKYSPDTLEYEK